MTYNIFPLLLVLPGVLLQVVVAFKATNAHFQTTTVKYCNKNLVDSHDNPAPCGKSMARETYGLTMPGMEDGSLTTREDVIVTKDGQVSVEASPSRPYQYMMHVDTPKVHRVDQMFMNTARTVMEETHGTERMLAAAAHNSEKLEEDGWINEGDEIIDFQLFIKWVRYGPEGVNPNDGTNYTALYQTGLVPNVWILYIDYLADRPSKLISLNTYQAGEIFQETTFDSWEALDDSVNVDEAMNEMYYTYDIDTSRSKSTAPPGDMKAPYVDTKHMEVDVIPEQAREFFENDEDYDWMPKGRRLRRGFKGIEYFTIEKGSAADYFFHAGKRRDLLLSVNFQFPRGCKTKRGRDAKFCLHALVATTVSESPYDGSIQTSLTVEAGIAFVDVNKPDRTASLFLSVTLTKGSEGKVLDLRFEASGCVVVFQLGAGFSLSIDVCIVGEGSGENLLQADLRTFSGSVDIAVSFNVNVPVLGSIINWRISAYFSVTARPHNDITAYGRIGTDISLWLAGAGVSVDVTGNTVENLANKWEFLSGVNFNAWIRIFFWGKSWNHRWDIWRAGPVLF